MLHGLSIAFLFLLPFAVLASPDVLVPGDGSSALEIQYQDMALPHWWCSKSSSKDHWERLWIPNLSELLPKNIDCWSQKMKLHYNATHVRNAPGVLGIRAIQGDEGLKLIQDKPSHFQQLLDALPNLQVATYDFRLSPRGNPEFMLELKQMIERARTSEGQKVTLISHSLGGLVVHHFLTSVVTAEWKQDYIRAWIPMAPAYGGTKITLKQLISGDAESISWLSGKDLKEEQRSYETSVWLLPNPQLYSSTDIIVTTNQKNYTVQDYYELFEDAGFENFGLQWDRVKNLTLWEKSGQLKDPQVAVYPIYGMGVDTVEQYHYQSSLEKQPNQINSQQGDGTVNLKSLEAGNHWAFAHPPMQRKGVSHVELLSDPQVVQYVQEIVKEGQKAGTPIMQKRRS